MRYDAFISYSHAADDALAPAVQRALQTLARPWNRRRALEVFRDQTGLAVSPNLWTSICAGLDESEHFVLLASPGAAESTWVNQEIEHWSASHSIDRLLPVLTAGEWIWDASAGDFDWTHSTAVPAALRGKFNAEPRHLDLRWARTETELDLRHSKFRESMAQLAAPMHGMTPQDLESSDVARFRRLVRLRRAVVVALCILLLLVSGAGVLAIQNAREARQQQALAEQQARRALSLQLLAQANVIADSQRTLSLLLTAEAARLSPKGAWGALISGLADIPGLIKIFDRPVRVPANAQPGVVDAGGKIYASVVPKGAAQKIQLWRLSSGKRFAQLYDDRLYGLTATELVPGPRGTLAAMYSCLGGVCSQSAGQGVGGSARSSAQLGIQVWDLGTRNSTHLPRSAEAGRLTFDHRGERLAAVTPGGQVRVWDIADQQLLASFRSPVGGDPTTLAFSPDDKMLALSVSDAPHILVWKTSRLGAPDPADIPLPATEQPGNLAFGMDSLVASQDIHGGVHLWDAATGKSAGQLPTGGAAVVDLVFEQDGTLATVDRDGLLRWWDVRRRQQLDSARLSGTEDADVEIQFSGPDTLISTGSDIRLWSASRRGQAGKELLHRPSVVTALAISSTGLMAYGDEDGAVQVWDAQSEQPAGRPLGEHPGGVTALAFAPDGTLASGGQDGSVQLWDPATGRLVQGPLRDHDGTVTSLAFSPGGTQLAVGYAPGARGGWHREQPIHVWDVKTGSLSRRLDAGLSGGVASVAFAPGGLFASAGTDFLASWDVRTWLSRILNEDPHGGPYTAVAFTNDGKTLASSADRFTRNDSRTVVLWRMPSGKPLGEPLDAGPVPAGVSESFDALAFSPNANVLAGGGPGGVQLWDMSTRQPLGGRLGSTPVRSIVASPDGRIFIAAGADGVVQSYPATVQGWLRSVCSVVSRNLTQREWDSFVGVAAAYERSCPQYPAG